MMNGTVSSEMAKNYLSVIHINASQLLRLINKLLDFRKFESGNLKLELSKGDLVVFVSGVVQTFSELAEDKGIKLKFNTVNNEVFMRFDPDKIEKIINNLVYNAIKFTEKGGQVSVNISKPGIVKGNHWHHTRNEKFLVVSGTGVIRFRKIGTSEVLKYHVTGEKLEAVDIPTGYTHNIENLGTTDMVTIMWASEVFDPEKPDTIFEEV